MKGHQLRELTKVQDEKGFFQVSLQLVLMDSFTHSKINLMDYAKFVIMDLLKLPSSWLFYNRKIKLAPGGRLILLMAMPHPTGQNIILPGLLHAQCHLPRLFHTECHLSRPFRAECHLPRPFLHEKELGFGDRHHNSFSTFRTSLARSLRSSSFRTSRQLFCVACLWDLLFVSALGKKKKKVKV